MPRKYIPSLLLATGFLIVLGAGVWLSTAPPASAQCGSQASSCKNCHEVQGVMPVNSDGTDWHTSHAFGDFCYICHAGNNQAQDQTEAHIGMVAPLEDVKAACMQCHPNDYEALAQEYATTLGVEIGAGGSTSTNVDQGSEQPIAAVSVPITAPIDLNDPNLVDYVQRYEEIVLGKKQVNWGNIILIGMIGAALVGGGGFVIKNEKWLDLSSLATGQIGDEYPADVKELLPAITKLAPQSRKTLQKILNKPERLEQILTLIEGSTPKE